jgi:hypothetical protein
MTSGTQYKVSATYPDGYRVLVSFLIAGREAPQKAQVIADDLMFGHGRHRYFQYLKFQQTFH